MLTRNDANMHVRHVWEAGEEFLGLRGEDREVRVGGDGGKGAVVVQ